MRSNLRDRVIICGFFVSLVGGCAVSETGTLVGEPITTTEQGLSVDGEDRAERLAQEPIGVARFSSNGRAKNALRKAKKNFADENFGLAEKYFRTSVERDPKNPEAWLGLAATYDQLTRYDLAERAYETAIDLVGEVPEILNNQGYSYMLQGKYSEARRVLFRAKQLDPDNPYIEGNIALLDEATSTGQ